MLTASLTSCEKIKSWFNVEIDTTIEGQLDVLTDEADLKSTEVHGFDASATVDVMNEDLAEYEDLIEDFKTKSVKISVESVDSTGVLILAGSEFSIYSSSNPGLSWPITQDWPIQVGTTVTLEADSYSVLNDMLEDKEPVTFSAVGTCNKGNVHISLTYGIDVTVESNPL